MTQNWITKNIPEDIANAIFKIRIELPNGKIVERDFSTDVSPNYDMLEEQLIETPAIYAFWSTVLSEQKFVVAKLERLIARRRSIICDEALRTARDDGGRVTKYVLDEIVEADDSILELQTKLMIAQRSLSKLFGVVDSLRIKSEALRSLAGFKRQEMRDS